MLYRNGWDYGLIAAFKSADHDGDARASKLDIVKSCEQFLNELECDLRVAFDKDHIRFGYEESDKHLGDYRIVIQFQISEDLFDYFFNGRNGYRAHFWQDYILGIRFNALIITRFREYFDSRPEVEFDGYKIGTSVAGISDFESTKIKKSFLINSLDSDWSKLWCCDCRIDSAGITDISASRSGPKIRLNCNVEWSTIYPRDEDSAWIDIKGGFVQCCDNTNIYQHKDPLERAKKLQKDGTA